MHMINWRNKEICFLGTFLIHIDEAKVREVMV